MTLMLYLAILLIGGVLSYVLIRYMFDIADKRLQSSLGLFLAFLVVWTLAVFLQSTSNSSEINLFLVKLAFVAATSAVASLVVFSYAVTHDFIDYKKGLVLLFSYVVLIGLNLSPYVISSVDTRPEGVIPVREPLYILVSVGIVSIGSYGIGRLYYHVKRTTNKQKQRQYIFIATGLALGLLMAVVTNVVLPNVVGTTVPGRFSAIAVIIFTATILYASLKHKFIDLKLAAVRTIAYIFSLLVMALIYFGLAYIISLVLFEDVATRGVSMSFGNILIAIVLALIFQPIRNFFDRVTNRIFYRDRYDTDEFIARLGNVLTKTTKLRQLLKMAATEVATTLKATCVTFVVHKEHSDDIVASSVTSATQITTEEYKEVESLLNYSERSILVIDEILEDKYFRKGPYHKILKLLDDRKVAIVLKLDAVGYALLGEQKSGGYTRRDIRVLQTIRDELIIAIHNARSVQEIREINTHLEQRVETATKELRRSNQKLMKIDETKDEFVSMASHQLRTPLTSIKGYISMLLDGDAGEMTEQQRKLLREAFNSSERMVHLISDFLNVSRLQTGKFIIERKPTDLAELVKEEIDSIASMAATRNIHVSYKGPEHFPSLQIDEDKIRQVVMNFIDNAIYYSRPQSTVVVRLKNDEKFATLEVHDHGIGVPKEAIEKLFTKFFRAENARRQRPDGTGVGLYLAKRVILGHKGELIMESTEGKGSVFGFRLPLNV